MTSVFKSMVQAFRDLFQVQVLWIVIWPMLAAVALWLILGVTFWSTFSGWITAGLNAFGIQTWLDGVEPRWVANGLQAMLHLILFVPAVFFTALVITGVFATPALIRVVADRDYPTLEPEQGGSFAGNLLNAFLAVGIFLAIWIVTLPLWLIGVGVIVPFVAAAYLNQRMFRFDALSEHATPVEMQILFSRYRSSWWGLGLLTGFLQFLPVLNLFAAVLTALAFIHYGLARLEDLRRHPGGTDQTKASV